MEAFRLVSGGSSEEYMWTDCVVIAQKQQEWADLGHLGPFSQNTERMMHRNAAVSDMKS